MREWVALLSLAGFAFTNAMETALLSLSFAQEKRIAKGIASGVPLWGKLVGKAYKRAFDDWKKYPMAFMMTILIANSAFSLLWCVLGLERMGLVSWAPLVIGAGLFLCGELIPKVLARRHPDKILLVTILPFYVIFSVIHRYMYPVVSLLEKATHWKIPV